MLEMAEAEEPECLHEANPAEFLPHQGARAAGVPA